MPQKPTAVPSTSATAPAGGPPRLKGEGLSTCLAYLEAAIKEAKGRGPKQGKGYNVRGMYLPMLASSGLRIQAHPSHQKCCRVVSADCVMTCLTTHA